MLWPAARRSERANSYMVYLILACIASAVFLLGLLRRDRVSLGLPVAYMFSLLLIHVPGAFAHLVSGGFLLNSNLVEISMRFTAVAAACFVAGVLLARFRTRKAPERNLADCQRFCWFCLLGGWFFIYGLSFLSKIPSLGAVVYEGGAIWMLGTL